MLHGARVEHGGGELGGHGRILMRPPRLALGTWPERDCPEPLRATVRGRFCYILTAAGLSCLGTAPAKVPAAR
jgi:hypothetical protein